MVQVALELPTRRATLRVQPSGARGKRVVKNTVTGEFFSLGEQETFLLEAFDGSHTFETLQRAFHRQFEHTLTEEELRQFIELASSNGLLEPVKPALASLLSAGALAPSDTGLRKSKNSLLYFRKSLVDPDRLLAVLEPCVRFFWTRWFFVAGMLAIGLAMMVGWANRFELVSRFPNAFSLEMVLLAWMTLIICTTCHEFAHGLTCKHYGGEVREIGVLVLLFTPCFYCNISDAWLFPERRKRLAVTWAGAWCDLLLWAAAMLIWRATVQDTVINYLAWIVLSVCGARIFFNLNPLLKLDGYYLLSDVLEIPNLRQRAWDAASARLRRVLWGAPRTQRQPREWFLTAFGLASWLFTIVFVSLVLFGFIRFLGARWGIVGFAGASLFALVAMKGLLTGLGAGEVRKMIRFRYIHTAFWILVLGGTTAALILVEVDHVRGGPFVARPLVRAELQAPVDGFLRDVEVDEGEVVQEGQILGRLEVRDLETLTLQKRNDIDEATAKVNSCKIQLEYAIDDCERADLMLKGQVMSLVEHRNAEKRRRSAEADLAEAQARMARLQEELAYLHTLAGTIVLKSPLPGVVMTPHFREKNDLFFEEGDSLCVIEDPAAVVIEISLPEQEFGPVRVGQPVQFKARSFPLETFHGTVQRIAPGASPGELQSTVTITCRLDNPTGVLRSGMTGHARIICGRYKLGDAVFERTLTFVRTEFWW